MNRNSGEETEDNKPRRRHRVIVWSLIVLASVLLIFSITANWVQTELLDTDEVTATTHEIVTDEDVEEQLSIYLVDQLYATVDVQGQLEERLPPPAQPLAAPIGARGQAARHRRGGDARSPIRGSRSWSPPP